jgi:hypothetical protein
MNPLTAESGSTAATLIRHSKESGWLGGIRRSQIPTRELQNIRFSQALEAFNPVQHLPVISSLWGGTAPQAAETAANPLMPMAKLGFGALLGGVIGFAAAAIGLVFQESTGQGVVESVGHAMLAPAPGQMQAGIEKYASVANAHKQDRHLWLNA